MANNNNDPFSLLLSGTLLTPENMDGELLEEIISTLNDAGFVSTQLFCPACGSPRIIRESLQMDRTSGAITTCGFCDAVYRTQGPSVRQIITPGRPGRLWVP